MNDNESMLAELRKVGAWADMQRKITKRTFIAIAWPFGCFHPRKMKVVDGDG